MQSKIFPFTLQLLQVLKDSASGFYGYKGRLEKAVDYRCF